MSKLAGKTVSIPSVRRVAYGLSLAGIASGPVLEAAGVSSEALFDGEGRIPAEQFAALWEAAAEASGESFGLRCSLAIPPLQDVLLGYLMRASPTLGDALAVLLRYQRFVQDASETTFAIGATTTVLLQEDTMPAGLIEWGFAAILRFASEGLGRKVLPLSTTLRHGPPTDTSLHHDVFGPNITFWAPTHTLTLDNKLLAEPLKTADQVLAHALDQRASEILRADPTASETVNSLHAVLEPLLCQGNATLGAAAKAMRLSSRSLQRRLAADRLSFREVVDTLRRSLAEAHIQDQSLSVTQVAFLLGFSDRSAFHRAFLRWYGQSPGAVRLEIAGRQQSASSTSLLGRQDN
jgi:AraC-like DNA-binding protein